jgi:hypothetical protein
VEVISPFLCSLIKARGNREICRAVWRWETPVYDAQGLWLRSRRIAENVAKKEDHPKKPKDSLPGLL